MRKALGIAPKKVEKGDYIGNADNHADQGAHTAYLKTSAEKTENSDDKGVQKLAGNKAAEYTVDETDLIYNTVCCLYLKQPADNL